MSIIKVLEVFAWLAFLAGVIAMFVRAAMGKRSVEEKTRTGRILGIAMLTCGPLLAVVYGLATLDMADTVIDSGRRGGEPWFPAVLGVMFTVLAPGVLRRTGTSQSTD